MTEICREPHPDRTGVTCNKNVHPYGDHYNIDQDVFWPGAPPPVTGRRKIGRALQIVHNIEASGLGVATGPPAVGPPPQAIREWYHQQPIWVAEAKRALRQVAQTHEQFTNGDVWPLVDNPGSRRAMVIVTRHGLASGWMEEYSAKREHGVWTTRDGVSFPLNKLIPVYRSLIHSSSKGA